MTIAHGDEFVPYINNEIKILNDASLWQMDQQPLLTHNKSFDLNALWRILRALNLELSVASQGKFAKKTRLKKKLLPTLFSACNLISDSINLLRQLFHDGIIHQFDALVFSNPLVNI